MHNVTFTSRLFLTFIVVIFLFISQSQSEISEQAQLGRELFYDPSFGGTLEPKKISGLACADCHADFDEDANPDGKIRAGHSIIGVPHRGEAKGGMIKADIFRRAAGGGGFCYQHFLQRVPADKVDPIAIPEEQAEALMAYFEHVSGENRGPQFELQMLDKAAANAAAEKIVAMGGGCEEGMDVVQPSLQRLSSNGAEGGHRNTTRSPQTAIQHAKNAAQICGQDSRRRVHHAVLFGR